MDDDYQATSIGTRRPETKQIKGFTRLPEPSSRSEPKRH
jgi:hypothetical protein